MMKHRRGTSLIEVLISMLIIVIASVATLQYFGPTRGQISKSGHRRAALERARQRMEQLLAMPARSVQFITPGDIDVEHQVSCSDSPTTPPNEVCGFQSTSESEPPLPVISTVQCRDDTPSMSPACDVLELAVKVWFVPVTETTTTDDDFHRVQLRTLRTP